MLDIKRSRWNLKPPLKKIATPMTNVNKTKTRKMDLFSRLWMRAIQIKNGKGEGMIFFETRIYQGHGIFETLT